MLPHINQLARRVRESESFPRIRDAEAVLKKKADEEYLARTKADGILKVKNEKKSNPFTDPKMPPREIPDPNYFTTYVLNNDPSTSQYLDFDEIVYPRIFDAEPMPPEALDRLWVSGFIDRAHRDQEKQRNMASLLNHSERKGTKNKRSGLKANSISYSKSLVGTEEDADLESVQLNHNRNLTLSSSGVQSGEVDVFDGNSRPNTPLVATTSFTLKPDTGVCQLKSLGSSDNGKTSSKISINKIKKRFSVYAHENKRLSKPLKTKEKVALLSSTASAASAVAGGKEFAIRAPDLEEYFEIEQREHLAAIVIQKMFRRSRVSTPLQHVLYSVLSTHYKGQ